MYCTVCGLERTPNNTDSGLGTCTCGNSAWCSLRPAPFAWPPQLNGGTGLQPPAAPS